MRKLYGELNAQIHIQSLILPGYKHPFQLDGEYIAGVRADHQVFLLKYLIFDVCKMGTAQHK